MGTRDCARQRRRWVEWWSLPCRRGVARSVGPTNWRATVEVVVYAWPRVRGGASALVAGPTRVCRKRNVHVLEQRMEKKPGYRVVPE